ncbi:hypothetical protein [Vagococcus silagei]|uniref:Uncharacterized protein n=1 Tax=Vagococcus silagei TaxID=2508885 RepID=A0A4S3B7X6_9ENTE|nr:hypothetical protein [Vagococcus silagei]THB62180.1 hypothetical protein ESZ54_01165 [Vagococcus silagei]
MIRSDYFFGQAEQNILLNNVNRLSIKPDIIYFTKEESTSCSSTDARFKKNQKLIIEGIECVVIRSYENTFSVSTPQGNRLVRLSDMKFVISTDTKFDRTRELCCKYFI